MGKFPATQAIRTLKKHRVNFDLCPYKYEDRGGTRTAAKELNLDEHLIIKTLVLETERGDPFLLLIHGDKDVSTKALARLLGVKSVNPSDSDVAHKHTGYVVGGISPFGTKKPLKVYIEESVMYLPKIYINAGRRGLLAKMSPENLERTLNPTLVNVAI